LSHHHAAVARLLVQHTRATLSEAQPKCPAYHRLAHKISRNSPENLHRFSKL
jgi:hypothetical protein